MRDRCFEISHISEGSISGFLRDDEREIFFDNGSGEDFIDDFMLAVLTVAGIHPAVEHRESFWAELEPMMAKWAFFGSNSRIRVTVTTYDNSRTVQEKSESLTLDKETLMRDVAEVLGDVLEKFGLCGYRHEWGHEFPLSLYLQLKDAVSGDAKTSLTKQISANENMGMPADGSVLSEELSLI